jgi:hypothetical protein
MERDHVDGGPANRMEHGPGKGVVLELAALNAEVNI